ncbi:MAG: hypothetical protein L3J23_03965 [Flavobacteriaceae bacterium]|nr:hypothetical protein [Flavobacteriaceae bacterium]
MNNSITKVITIIFLSIILSCNTSCNTSSKNNNNVEHTFKEKKNILEKENTLNKKSNFKIKKFNYSNYLHYADFPYKSIINKNTIEIPVCKTILDSKRENIIDVDFGGSIFIKQEKEWDEEQLKTIQENKIRKLSEKYNIWAKIIQKDEYLLDKVNELREGVPPDQPCLFHNKTPTYYIYLNKIKDTTWVLIEATKDNKRVDALIGL